VLSPEWSASRARFAQDGQAVTASTFHARRDPALVGELGSGKTTIGRCVMA
jgi:ABC-type glutathione transport system ATPase component